MKKYYYYFKCDTVYGKNIIGVEVEGNLMIDAMDAERDLKTIILEPAERMIDRLPRKPRGYSWEQYRKPWCIIGVKENK